MGGTAAQGAPQGCPLRCPSPPEVDVVQPAVAVLTSEVRISLAPATNSTETRFCAPPETLPADVFFLKSTGVTCFSRLRLTPKLPVPEGAG